MGHRSLVVDTEIWYLSSIISSNKIIQITLKQNKCFSWDDHHEASRYYNDNPIIIIINNALRRYGQGLGFPRPSKARGSHAIP